MCNKAATGMMCSRPSKLGSRLRPKVRRRLLANAPFSELSAEDLWREPPEEPEGEVAHVA